MDDTELNMSTDLPRILVTYYSYHCSQITSWSFLQISFIATQLEAHKVN